MESLHGKYAVIFSALETCNVTCVLHFSDRLLKIYIFSRNFGQPKREETHYFLFVKSKRLFYIYSVRMRAKVALCNEDLYHKGGEGYSSQFLILSNSLEKKIKILMMNHWLLNCENVINFKYKQSIHYRVYN